MTLSPSTLAACCAGFYGHPLVELIAGQSFHPGGLSTTHRLLTEARLGRGARLLDTGCGLGASARVAALAFGLAVDACDVSAAALRRASVLAESAGAHVRYRQASVLRLPYADGTFAATLAECVLTTTAKRAALAELRRVTGSGGMLLMSDVTAGQPLGIVHTFASVVCLSGAWRPGELEELLPAVGYHVVRRWDESGALLPMLDRLEARLDFLAVLARDPTRVAGCGTRGVRRRGLREARLRGDPRTRR